MKCLRVLAVLIPALVLGSCQSATGSSSSSGSNDTVVYNGPAAAYVQLTITRSDSAKTWVYVDFCDSARKSIQGGSVVIAGTTLTPDPNYYDYYADMSFTLLGATSVAYTLIDASGKKATGTAPIVTTTLDGLTYSPAKPAAGAKPATSYTVSPPGGTWPAGSYIACDVSNGFYPAIPTGTKPWIWNGKNTGGYLDSATSVNFWGCIVLSSNLSGLPGTVASWGPRTSW